MFGFFERGKIVITPEKYNYSPGEIVKGKVSITLKKPIIADKFSITLLGEKTTTSGVGVTFGDQGGNNPTQPNRNEQVDIIFQFELPLDGVKEYSQMEYPFEITISLSVASQVQNNTPKGLLGGIASIVSVGTCMPVSRTDWYLIAKLDIPKAIDMREKLKINVA